MKMEEGGGEDHDDIPRCVFHAGVAWREPPHGQGASEGKGPRRWPQRRLGRRLEEVAKAVEGGYCRLQMPLKLALGVRGTVAGHRLGAPEPLPPRFPSNASLPMGL